MLFAILVPALSAQAQFNNCINLERVNSRLAGHVVDYTNNHGSNNRVFSPILGMPRDLYVYLPPGYNPGRAYSFALFFHMADSDENFFVGPNFINELDNMIVRGEFPPAIIACPDGTYHAWNQFQAKHSFYVNGLGGRFKDHILQEVIPFMMANYAIRPERQAHGLVGFSAGGYGAMGLAIEHRYFFGAVATLASPLNLRYSNVDGKYFENFDPASYRSKTSYDPNEIIGTFAAGILRVRAQRFMQPVFGQGDAVAPQIIRTNPADLIMSTNLRPGDLAIYVSYPGRDNFNFDAQAESFQWLANQRGIEVTAVRDPRGTHRPSYFRQNERAALLWLGQHLLPPAP
jgi:S-formylglutathione hydrolase FrmB